MTAGVYFFLMTGVLWGRRRLGSGRRSEGIPLYLKRWRGGPGAAGMAEKPMPADFMGFTLWLLVLAVVCMYGYHFTGASRLYVLEWDSWEETYRGSLRLQALRPISVR